MLPLVLAVALSAAESIGAPGPGTTATVEQREAVRFRAGVHFAAAAGLGVQTGAVALGPGLSVEFGAVFKDRYSLVARATGFTAVVFTGFSFGLGFDAALSDVLTLGAGVAWSGISGVEAPSAISVGVPLRLVVAPFGRKVTEVGRSGLVFFAEVMPGYAYVNGRGYRQSLPAEPRAPLSLMATLGVGYLWW